MSRQPKPKKKTARQVSENYNANRGSKRPIGGDKPEIEDRGWLPEQLPKQFPEQGTGSKTEAGDLSESKDNSDLDYLLRGRRVKRVRS